MEGTFISILAGRPVLATLRDFLRFLKNGHLLHLYCGKKTGILSAYKLNSEFTREGVCILSFIYTNLNHALASIGFLQRECYHC